MIFARRQEKSKKIERIGEFSVGFGLIAKGWDEAAHFSHFPLRVTFIFLAGVFVILGTALHRPLEKRIRNYAGLFHVLEGLAEIIVATILLEKGSHWIPVFLSIIGLNYLGLGLTTLLSSEQNRQKALRTFRIAQGVAFIVFAAAVCAVNVLTDRKTMVYAMAFLLAAAGVVILIRFKAFLRKSSAATIP